MLTSFAAIPANGLSSPSSPDANASPSGTNPPAEENPMLIDPQIMMNDKVIKVTVPMTGTGLLNPIPYITGFVKHLTMADPSALLLSNDSNVAAITMSSEVPKDKKIDHFVSAAQMSGDHCQYCFFLKYHSTMTPGQIKFENPRMMLWLKEARMWLAPHSHPSLYTTTIGFMACT
jgi:hypothetical protein